MFSVVLYTASFLGGLHEYGPMKLGRGWNGMPVIFGYAGGLMLFLFVKEIFSSVIDCQLTIAGNSELTRRSTDDECAQLIGDLCACGYSRQGQSLQF